ncbi:MAG: hypothetical protein ACYC61_25725 [Isosphaeraceae bacterium]
MTWIDFVWETDTETSPEVVKVMNELESFHRFLADQLSPGDSMLSPEECLDLWRARNPPEHPSEAEVEAIREAIDDMRAGDAGQPVREFLGGFREGERTSA